MPLLFGLIVVVPPQPFLGLVHSGYTHGYGYFMLHDAFSFRRVGGENLPADMHLWFVIYLLAYTLALCALSLLPTRWLAAMLRGTETLLAGPGLLPLGTLIVFAIRMLPGDWTDTHHFLNDPNAHLHYGLMFLFGIALRRSELLRLAIAKQWPAALVAGLVGYAAVALDACFYPGNVPTPPFWQVPVIFAKAVQSWGIMIALFGIADRFWNVDGSWRATLAEAVFPFYIIHQTVQVAVEYWLMKQSFSALTEFLILIAATVVGCWSFYLIGREIGPLRPLIGLNRHRRAKPAMVEVAAPVLH
nr:acyltransferase family protein [Novosphingobium sp. 9]